MITQNQKSLYNQITYWINGSKTIQEPFTITKNNREASFEPSANYQTTIVWKNIVEDIEALVENEYLTEEIVEGIKQYRLNHIETRPLNKKK
jgi:hypothetical protein